MATPDPYFQSFSHPHLLQLTNSQTLTLNTPCSGCELQSSGWMYTCKPCNFALHVSCTQMPQLINHPSHRFHPLALLPKPPYPRGEFICDGCERHGWGFCYHCNHCPFDLHILCATQPRTAPAPGGYQPRPPVGTLQNYQNSQVGMSTAPANNNVYGNVLLNVAAQGFVNGAAQYVGHNLMQNMMNDGSGGGGNGGDPGGNSDGDNSSSLMGTFGSSIFSGIFEGTQS